ncbi:MAG TPA: hypothetical protein PLD52_08200 [Bacteroidales bacterium]|nr:hypothetical protein [Bacteroidales bacterium]
MKALRLTSLILLCIVLLTGIPYLGYVFYQRYSKPASLPLDAVPEKAAFVIRLNEPGSLYEELTKSNLIWKEVSAYPGISKVWKDVRMIDSITGKDRDISRMVKEHPFYIVLALTGRSEFGLMYLGEAGHDVTPSGISDFLKKNYPGKTTLTVNPYASTQILRFHPDGMKEPLFISVTKGVFIMSHYSNLVKKAIDRLSLNYIPGSSANFRTIERTSGKRADANIFVNIPYLSLSTWKIASEETRRDLVRLARFADWCGLDISIRKDELLMNGYLLCSDSNYYTLALYEPHTPQSNDGVDILPDNINAFTLFSLEKLGWYLGDLQMRERRLESAIEPGRLTRFNEARNMRVEGYFLPWTMQQLCFATASMNDRDGSPYRLITIQHNDPDTARYYLQSLAKALGKKTDSVRYDSLTIYLADLSDPLNAVFGNFRPGIQTTCYVMFRGYTIFAASPFHLVSFINHYNSGALLVKDRSYTNVADNISGQSNILFFCKPGSILASPPSLFNETLSGYIRDLSDSLRKFESLTMQVINKQGLYYTSISLRFNPNPSDESQVAWQCPLDTTVSGAPQIVPKNSHGDQVVLATDTLNSLYMIDSSGLVLWKKKLYGKVLGTFHPIYIRGSDSLFYLFNTENHLYLIRSDGVIADRFPMKFPLRATNGLTVTDYNNTRDYCIFVAFRDNRVYNFSLGGVLTEGWSLPKLSQPITRPVQYLVYNHKDHLAITGSEGEFLITDRRGEVRIKPAKPFTIALGSGFFLNRSGRNGALLTTDHQGHIILLAENGKTSSLTCNFFTPRHVFLYEDMTGNKVPDYIFFDRNILSYYNRSLKMFYSYHFTHPVAPPHIIRTVNNHTYIGIYSSSTREVFLFDRKGLVETESAIRGSTPFDLGNVENKTTANLVIGAGKAIKCYRLTQP